MYLVLLRLRFGTSSYQSISGVQVRTVCLTLVNIKTLFKTEFSRIGSNFFPSGA